MIISGSNAEIQGSRENYALDGVILFMNQYKENRKRVKNAVRNKLNQVSFKDFFTVFGLGVGIGLIFACLEDLQSYYVALAVGCTASLTSFMIFAVPKIAASFKSPPPEKSIGDYIGAGEDGMQPRVNAKNKIKLVEPRF